MNCVFARSALYSVVTTIIGFFVVVTKSRYICYNRVVKSLPLKPVRKPQWIVSQDQREITVLFWTSCSLVVILVFLVVYLFVVQ